MNKDDNKKKKLETVEEEDLSKVSGGLLAHVNDRRGRDIPESIELLQSSAE